MLRAGGALLRVKIEIFWKIALNAGDIVEEWLVAWTLARILLLYVPPSPAAFLAILDRYVEVASWRTSFAPISLEYGPVGLAASAGLQVGVVEEIGLASFAGFVLVVKVLGKVAGDAGGLSLEGLARWTHAFLKATIILLSLLALPALPPHRVEILRQRTGYAQAVVYLVGSSLLTLAPQANLAKSSPCEAILAGLG